MGKMTLMQHAGQVMLVVMLASIGACEKKDTSEYSPPADGVYRLYSVGYRGKEGLIDATGKLVKDVVYDFASTRPEHDRYVLNKGDEYELINSSGKLLYWTDKFILVINKTRIALLDDLSHDGGQIVDLETNKVITDFTDIICRHGTEQIALRDKKGKWALCDMNGKPVTGYVFDWLTPSSDGIAAAKKDGKWGYIDDKGNWLISPQWKNACEFTGGYGLVMGGPRDLFWFVDKDGKQLGSHTFSDGHEFSEGLAAVSPSSSELWGYIDTTGRFVIEPKFVWTSPFSGGLAAVCISYKKGEKTGVGGYINKKGEVVLRFKNAGKLLDFDGELAEVVLGDKEGYIDRKGRWVWLKNDKRWLDKARKEMRDSNETE